MFEQQCKIQKDKSTISTQNVEGTATPPTTTTPTTTTPSRFYLIPSSLLAGSGGGVLHVFMYACLHVSKKNVPERKKKIETKFSKQKEKAAKRAKIFLVQVKYECCLIQK